MLILLSKKNFPFVAIKTTYKDIVLNYQYFKVNKNISTLTLELCIYLKFQAFVTTFCHVTFSSQK